MKTNKQCFFLLMIIIQLSVVLLCGCSPATAKTGDYVKVHYTLKLADGTVFDTSIGGEPIEFIMGQGKVLPAFEQAIIGMKVGESKTFTLTADQAYGQRSDGLIFFIGRDELPPDIVPEVGMQLSSNQGIVTIVEVTDMSIKIDANHPLAGKELTFDIELIGIGGSQSQGASLTLNSLEEALVSGKPTLAEFGRGTCVPCKQMKPILEELAAVYKDKLNVAIISIDDYYELTISYEVLAIPTQILFDAKGKEIFRHIGFWSKEAITAKLTELGIL
jgi:peptidylprolyl isomerase